VPLIQEFSPESAKKIFGSSVTRHVLVFTDKTAAHHAPTLAALGEYAAAFKGRTLAVNVPSSENKVLDFFGLKNSDLPTVILADMSSEGSIKKFPYSGEITADGLTTFVNAFFAGSLKPTLKSEAVAPEDTAGPVIVLKGESFNDLVLNNDKDVFVEFYAPWCSHCKKLAPIWDELAAKYSKDDNVVIAKMDATANEIDVEGLSVKGFPTIYFFKGNDKTHPIKFEESRELDDFVTFLKKNSHHTINHDEL